ncbi:Serine/threonine-protein kinase ATM, partial [Cucurbita argyrosperma subsp. argyrosperma]
MPFRLPDHPFLSAILMSSTDSMQSQKFHQFELFHPLLTSEHSNRKQRIRMVTIPETSQDIVLKAIFGRSLVLYGRLQISLTRADDERFFVEQLLDVLYKDLDQSSISSVGVPWSDTNKDDKFGTLSSSHCGLVELAAAVLYRACVTSTKAISTEKRVKRDPASVHLKEELAKGKWLWNAAFCCLVRNYHSRISKDLFTYWFEAICSGFERILKDANVGHSYDGLLWTLRSLQELSSVLIDSTERSESSSEEKVCSSFHCILILLFLFLFCMGKQKKCQAKRGD